MEEKGEKGDLIDMSEGLGETSKEIEERKEKAKKKISSLIKNKYTAIFIGIFILGIIIRLYFFFVTKNQPLWWDEADYMAYAKNLAGIGNVDWIVTPKHNSLFPYLAAALLKLSSSELVSRFILELIPSILLVYLTYKICILMYKDKKIALISTFLMATLWDILFESFRFQLDVPALFFAFLSIYIFWQGYERKEKIFGKINSKYSILITVFFVFIVYSIRKSYALFGIFFLIYMLATKDFKTLIKDKYNWVSLVLAGLLYLFFNKFVFISSLDISSTISDAFGFSPDFSALQIFGAFFGNVFNPALSVLIWLFWIGFFILLFNLFIGFKFLRKKEGNEELKSDFFFFLTIVLTLILFFFINRNGQVGEPRWYFPLLLGSFVCISKGTLLVTNFIGKYYKTIGVIVLIFLVGFGGYYEYKHADMIIKNKVNSYSGIKEAGLFLKDNSNIEDIIINVPVSQAAYYSERISLSPAGLVDENRPNNKITFEEFLDKVKNNSNVKYIIVSFSEPGHSDWMRKEGEEYVQNPQTGEVTLSKWEIPFMNTTIDFINNKQDIKQEKTYGNLTFKLIAIKEDAFVYEIIHSQ
ncbi:MAG: glycosyltransferase family 39 protein [Candidatus Pacearchaeota archaeon]